MRLRTGIIIRAGSCRDAHSRLFRWPLVLMASSFAAQSSKIMPFVPRYCKVHGLRTQESQSVAVKESKGWASSSAVCARIDGAFRGFLECRNTWPSTSRRFLSTNFQGPNSGHKLHIHSLTKLSSDEESLIKESGNRNVAFPSPREMEVNVDEMESRLKAKIRRNNFYGVGRLEGFGLHLVPSKIVYFPHQSGSVHQELNGVSHLLDCEELLGMDLPPEWRCAAENPSGLSGHGWRVVVYLLRGLRCQFWAFTPHGRLIRTTLQVVARKLP